MTYYLYVEEFEPIAIGKMSFSKVFYTDDGWTIFKTLVENKVDAKYKIIDENIVSAFMGESMINTWRVLEPYIKQERKLRTGEYQEFFEDLVVRVSKNTPESERKRLNLQKL